MKRDGTIPTAGSGDNKTMREISLSNFPSARPKGPANVYLPEPVSTSPGSRLKVLMTLLMTLPLRLLQMATAMTSPYFLVMNQ